MSKATAFGSTSLTDKDPQRDADGFLPDDTIFKVRSSFPLALRAVLIIVSFSAAAVMVSSGFEVIDLPVWLDIALLIAMLGIVLFAARLGVEDAIARETSPDHRPGAFDRAMEAYLARHRFARWLHDGTDFIERWFTFKSWRGFVGLGVFMAIALVITLVSVYLQQT